LRQQVTLLLARLELVQRTWSARLRAEIAEAGVPTLRSAVKRVIGNAGRAGAPVALTI
jgi:hypothetical protein